MNAEKLKQLRARYTDKGAFDADDPVLVRAAQAVDPTTNTSQFAAQVLFEEFALMAESVKRGRA